MYFFQPELSEEVILSYPPAPAKLSGDGLSPGWDRRTIRRNEGATGQALTRLEFRGFFSVELGKLGV
jgi:hypothetical protein